MYQQVSRDDLANAQARHVAQAQVMDRGPGSFLPTASETARQPTDLENVQQRLLATASFGAEINNRIVNLVIRLRGALGPAKGEANAVPQPIGLISEMKSALDAIGTQQGAAMEMLDALEALI